MTAFARGECPKWLDVSRETLERLDKMLSLVEHWNPAINLVAAGSIPAAWERHILDSAQVFLHLPPTADQWVDFGSGAGFPGLVIAILAAEHRPGLSVTLVESDKRKATFLMQAARELGVKVRILSQRAEDVADQKADVVSARALAALGDLFGLIHRHLKPNGIALFPKGARANDEVNEAQKSWLFDLETFQSRTDPTAQILKIKNLQHV